MKLQRLSFLSICFGALLLQACSHVPGPPEASWAEPVSGEISLDRAEHAVLAGEWEYEESGMVVPLRLDQFGNGSYDFKDGRFRTDVLSDHRWAGPGLNGKTIGKGRFEITLSPDYSEGEGRWWYTHPVMPRRPRPVERSREKCNRSSRTSLCPARIASQ
ncbi:MAG: hypothetical protein IPO99_20465 [Nitrospira sp.]|nr:hypothetical protein [Nitrospira sp.]